MLTYLEIPTADVRLMQEEWQYSINEWEDEGGASEKIYKDVDILKSNNMELIFDLLCFETKGNSNGKYRLFFSNVRIWFIAAQKPCRRSNS